ncbi:hypothetical protein TNCV_3120281 [Trichonephila clavipes]|uniref:Uncharacterized protein n=1 Tax=Trichonephila clavipes TaxID=2585209 RepID=A0A8X6W9P2_TRICX|nr:hypothetical protein TNCV_3120281 [Trichonephila clavipes]
MKGKKSNVPFARASLSPGRSCTTVPSARTQVIEGLGFPRAAQWTDSPELLRNMTLLGGSIVKVTKNFSPIGPACLEEFSDNCSRHEIQDFNCADAKTIGSSTGGQNDLNERMPRRISACIAARGGFTT